MIFRAKKTYYCIRDMVSRGAISTFSSSLTLLFFLSVFLLPQGRIISFLDLSPQPFKCVREEMGDGRRLEILPYASFIL